ncbi:MAG TPA: hypothetical protein VFK57_25330 [Vicinamibacterales bacterium]|nr:hypothetical protein [Vicinamibacterales bacterium]
MSFIRCGFAFAFILGCAPGAAAQTFSVPVRWCVIGDDANGNGTVDPGELGAPAFTTPGTVGEVDADNVLWRRHERPTDSIFIPEANITFRSALYNIVESSALRFPIIPDPDPNPTGDAFWQYGDILHPNDSAFEWNAAHNACVAAWSDVHMVEDIGVVVINANNMRTLAGDSEPGVAILSGRRMLLRDNAYQLPGSSLNTFPVSDHVDKHFAHEMGHALAGLRHTCSNQNVMSNRRIDTNGDALVDNIHLSASIAHVIDGIGDECAGGNDTTAVVNQIQLLRNAAQAVPGCKIAGTDTDCTSHSDVRADRIRDAAVDFVDLSTFTASRAGETVKLVHEPMGPLRRVRDVVGVVDPRLAASTAAVRPVAAAGVLTDRHDQSIDYYSFIDQDSNPATGGDAKSLNAPVDFAGAEIATRVRVTSLGAQGFGFAGTVWRFTGGAFQEVTDRRIRAYGFPITATSQRGNKHLTDQITIELPTSIFGAGVSNFRLQAAVVTVAAQPQVLDLLDEDPTKPGRAFRWRSPTFPVCSVTPAAAQRLGAITVQSSGLLPNRGVHLIFGHRHVANGFADASGSVSISTSVPAWAADGLHLMTVGTDNTALTADCTANVRGGPQPPKDPGEAENRPFEYAAKLVCGVQRSRSDLRLARGAYRTIVNIRNPGPDPLTITKELVLVRDQRQGEVLPFSEDELAPTAGLVADCEDIMRRVFGSSLPTPFVDAWLVVRSRQRLDVTSVHTAAPLTWLGRAGGVRTMDVQRIEPTPAPRVPARKEE